MLRIKKTDHPGRQNSQTSVTLHEEIPKMADAESGPLLDGLIASKLFPPLPDPRLIARPAFVSAALKDLPRGRVITIVAPAGSGKSSLMTQLHSAYSEHGVATSWLGLDVEDNDPATFALYFISALQFIEPMFARDELTALGANPVRDYDSLFERLSHRLSALSVPAALFLDDFQHITEPRILRFLNQLTTHLQRNLSLVVASRHRLPLQLAKLLVTGFAIEVAQDDLNFDGAEAELFLKRYHQIELSPTDLDSLLESTEGWPTGVQLAALALRRHKGAAAELIKTFSGRDRDLTRYLVESVIRAQAEPVRQFLLKTSPLRRMCADLCDAATGDQNGREMLDYIGRANLFLIALDRDGQWYRYHHLFAEFLQNEFRKTDPAGYRKACAEAARWCEAHGQPAEAIRYALEAEHFEQAADLIAHHAMRASLFQGDHYTVLDWMKRLPARFHDQRPEILLSHAWSCAFSRETAKAMTISQQAIDKLSADQPGHWSMSSPERLRWQLWAHTVQAATKACSDDIEDCLVRGTALFPQARDNEPFLIATLSNCLSYSYFALRDFDRSREFALSAHEQGHAADAAYLSAWGDFLHGLIDVELGQLNAANEFGHQVQRDSLGLGLGQKSYVAGLCALLQCEIAVQRCDFDSTPALIAVGRAFKEIFGPVEPQLVAVRNEARLQAHLGRLDLALLVLHEGQDAALRERHRRLYVSLTMEEISLQLTAGNSAGASLTMQRSKLLDGFATGPGWLRAKRDAIQLLEARLKLAESDSKSALRILTNLQQSRGAQVVGGFPIAVAANRAVALWELGQHSEAARQLDRALSAAAGEFHAFPIVSVGGALIPVLESMAARRSDAAAPELSARLNLQNWLIAYLSGNRSAPRSPEGGTPIAEVDIELLTAREIELLKLLHAGLDNRKIASTLLLSVPTVKWHLHNVYSKLQVGSRGAAVARAAQVGLI
ncbi:MULTISPECIES: LuxR C-terminal-related transcriptional regulator [Hydrocarboniphaga]|jgi:ATP/maltotriose-dependent transcriptional regulator MalT|uniref:LuxR C-terminal-related transcriptional regulator n=3 Tax=Nevskiaceae TaxID=568386 RepID=UPI002AB8B287|nr:LuxR C-terminal-related transcriptional regulator [Hydrocarboniphaga sp.]MDZ4078424.1 LuxR C-terminal-related transcriptional regulator [Hydrocarboniphaga sp.]